MDGKRVMTMKKNDQNMAEKKLILDLDSFHEDGYFYTKYDIGGSGHSITIRADDKEAFIAAFLDETRKRLEQHLEECTDE